MCASSLSLSCCCASHDCLSEKMYPSIVRLVRPRLLVLGPHCVLVTSLLFVRSQRQTHGTPRHRSFMQAMLSKRNQDADDLTLSRFIRGYAPRFDLAHSRNQIPSCPVIPDDSTVSTTPSSIETLVTATVTADFVCSVFLALRRMFFLRAHLHQKVFQAAFLRG